MAKETFSNSLEFLSNLTVQGTVSAGTFDSSNASKWDSVYSNVLSNSASYATKNFVDTKFFTLSGGTIGGNVTIFGDLTSTGTQTFANTIFTTTSSLGVYHVGGSGPALVVSQDGLGDIASFYDLDQGVEVFHIGGVNSTFPHVGVKVSNPNKDFTVNGEISASGDIWTSGRILSGGQELLGLIQPSIANIYNTVNANSATSWNYQGTDLKDLSADWQNTYTTVNSFSSFWEESAEIIPTVTNYLSTSNVLISSLTTIEQLSVSGGLLIGQGPSTLYADNNKVGILTETPNETLTVFGNISASGYFFGDGSQLSGIVAGDIEATTLVRTNSAAWESTYTNFSPQSANNVSVYTTVQTNSAAWMAASVYIKKYDYVVDGIDYSYSGIAADGTLETDPVWTVTRLVFSDVGALSASGVAQNITWTERLTATYV